MVFIDDLMAGLQPQTRYVLEEKQRVASAINRQEPMRGMFYDPGLMRSLAYIGEQAGDEVSQAYLNAVSHCPAGQQSKILSRTFVDRVIDKGPEALHGLDIVSRYSGDSKNEEVPYQRVEGIIELFLR
jgi:hypothetical protein